MMSLKSNGLFYFNTRVANMQRVHCLPYFHLEKIQAKLSSHILRATPVAVLCKHQIWCKITSLWLITFC